MPEFRPLQICIATGDIAGPIRNGGIGTFLRALAFELAAAGHRVAALYILGEFCEDQTIDHWRTEFAKKGVEFVPLSPLCSFTRPHIQARAAYDVYLWLRERHFDLVHFPDWRGHAFYSVLAKKQGLAFGKTLFAVGTHGPTAWQRDGNGLYLTELDDLQTDYLERISVALADRVISPSRYMLRWLEDRGWKFPDKVDVIQYVQPVFLPAGPDAEPIARPVSELVFFGRIEVRKGVTVFCDALDRLDPQVAPSVTFLGKLTTIEGQPGRAYIQSRAAKWKFPITILDTLDHASALKYLSQPGRVAVICSLLENSPNTVMECLSNNVPCLATDIGGIPELIDPRDRERTLFAPRPAALAERLAQALRNGHAPSRAAIHPEITRQQWLDWHDQIARGLDAETKGDTTLYYAGGAEQPTEQIKGRVPFSSGAPFISVVLITYNRSDLLRQAVESLANQTFTDFEVILVDDGSTNPAAVACLDEMQPDFDRRGWKIVRQRNMFVGAARNTGFAASRGSWILFMDDDNVAKPHELATFAGVARHGSADIYTCLLDIFSGDTHPTSDAGITCRWLPIGGAVAVGPYVNSFGDTNGIIRRDVYQALGGYSEDRGLSNEDWELYARAALAGYNIQVIPEALFYYRVIDDSTSRSTARYANHMRSLRPYLKQVGPALAGALELAVGIYSCGQLPAPPPQPGAAVVKAAAPINGDPDAFQRLVDEYWDSCSWRLSAPLRNTIMRLRGQRPAPRPVVSSRYSADIIINDIRSSISWEITGPLRAMGRLVNALRRR